MTTTNTPVNNGVNVQALLDARNRPRRRPRGRPVHLEGFDRMGRRDPQPLRGRRVLRSRRRPGPCTTFSFDADHPEVFASEDHGATPVEFVLVGLASCLTAGVAAVAQNRGIQLNSVKATIEGDMDILGILGGDPEVRNGFNDIKVKYDIDADASQEDIEALVAQSQKRSRCST